MQSIRRSVFRAVTSSSSLVKPRCLTTTSNSFLIRASRPVATTQILNFRRWSSDEAFNSHEENSFEASEFSDSTGRPDRTMNPESTGIYIGNLSFEVTQDELAREFAQFGEIKDVRLATDARGLSKGFGYVQFENIESAKEAISAKDQAVFEGRRMIVNFQITKSPRAMATEPSKTLFIGNLAFEMSDADLNKLFREIKNVVDVRVAIDRRTGQPRGFAHADFVDVASAQTGLEVLQGKEVYGRQLRVDFSGAAKDRTPFSPGRSRESRY